MHSTWLMGFTNFVVAPFLKTIDDNPEPTLAEAAKKGKEKKSSSLSNLTVT